LLVTANAFAQKPIWRCTGNAYTNDQAEATSKGCKIVEGGNVTVVTGTRVVAPAGPAAPQAAPAAAPGVKVATAPQAAPRVDSAEQRARDGEARVILEAELKKAETRREELLKEWNNGEPEKMGPEHRNYQKYLDRVAELKASLTRTETDIAGLKRELSRAK
jgi:hypothetical protein